MKEKIATCRIVKLQKRLTHHGEEVYMTETNFLIFLSDEIGKLLLMSFHFLSLTIQYLMPTKTITFDIFNHGAIEMSRLAHGYFMYLMIHGTDLSSSVISLTVQNTTPEFLLTLEPPPSVTMAIK